jgi:ABC-2 type transport system permease protein
VTAQTATAAPPVTVPMRAAGPLASAISVGTRTVRKFVRTPQLIVMGFVQGAMFLLSFRYVFGGAISIAGMPYVDFLVPGYVTTMVLFVGGGAAVGVADDVSHGFFDRLRSLPISRGSVMAGRALADTLLVAWNLVLVAALGFAVGFRLHASVPSALAAFGLCVLFGFAFEWLFILMGLLSGNAQAATGMSMAVFPFSFVSSAYIPTSTMPWWLRGFAANQPVTMMVNAVRSLTDGPRMLSLLHQDAAHFIWISLAWTAGIIALAAPAAALKFARG